MLRKVLVGGALLLQAAVPAIAQQRHCATPDPHTLPASEQAVLQQIERHTQRFIAQQATTGNTANRTSATLYTIPVVVHVLYNTAAQNISDAQIQSQIDVLNKDFSRTNTDAGNTPSVFSGVAADFQIRFQLATRDPNGNTTTGILRKSTTKTYFEYGGADVNGVFVKQSAQGGDDAWNTTQYLNMWVCNFGGSSSSLLGYATFPSDAGTYKDGVVMGYKYFGVNPSLGGVFGYGRTATHEVGHWLNLRHIWGDANCGNDLVSDTPTQQTSNGGCPSFPHVTCSNGANGDMFMNYMDYVDDQCMNMFTNGQKARAVALFATGGTRVSLLTSPGLGTGTPATCGVPASLSSSAITSAGATVSWGSVSGATSYNLQYKTTAASTWTTVSGLTTTSRALTGLTASTAYQFQVQSVCSSGTSAYSTTGTFTTLSATGGGTYCTANATNVTYEYIDKVALGSISRTSGADGGYYDGTALSTSVAQGSSQTLTYSAGFVSTAYTEYWNVWVDFNRDGDFVDAGEQIVTNRSSNLATDLTSAFTVPATASVGTTRMRVSMADATGKTSCGSYTYGEVEDYTLNITAGTGTTCGAASGLASSAISSSGATVSWTAVSGATSYNLQYKTTAGTTWTTVSGLTTTSRVLTGLTASTAYQFQVQTVCSGGSAAYSTAATFTTSAATTIPTYCVSKGTSVAYEWIDKVAIGSISRTSVADAGYYNGTALSTTVAAGSSQTITFSAGFASTAYGEYFRIYADWNNDGDFLDAGATVATDRTATFTVPATALNGAHRLRVVMSDASTAASCTTNAYGETEDYTLTVTGGAARREATMTFADLSVYPNPTEGAASLRLTMMEAGELTIVVRDLQGRVIAQQSLTAQAGAIEHALPTLSSGLYVVSVRTAGAEQVTKLVVTH
jgi:GEVED domain/Pregnancy-associated plasma protein-A/Fibronectin type III domain/Secretion system C-terminal sorting domain